MIHGIGADIVEVERISELCRHYGDRFQERILTLDEMQAFDSSASPMHFLAKRFAAKEAFSKALGTGLRYPVSFGNITVVKDGLGKPGFRFNQALSDYLQQLGISHCHLSLSDERTVACAFVVIER